MLVISESEARALVSVDDAIATVEQTFAAMARGAARNYPVVRELVGYQDAVFGVKTGCDSVLPLLGLKAGGYWPRNQSRQLGNHQSSTVLFDPDTGRACALVSANYLTGVRTGAASAVATKHLSRTDSKALGIIGAGVQAEYQLRATLAVRPLDRVHAFDQHRRMPARARGRNDRPESFRGSIGDVAAGLGAGRRTSEEITLFYGTGVALQDLAVAALAVRLAKAQGIGTTVDY